MSKFLSNKDNIIAILFLILYAIVMSFLGHAHLRSSVLKLYLFSIILALLLSIPVILFKLGSDNKSINRKLSILSTCLFVSILLVVSFNRIKVSDTESYKVLVIKKYMHREYDRNIKRHNRKKNYWIKVRIRDTKYISDDILVNYNVWDNVKIGSEHVMKIKKGFLGIDTYLRFY